MNQYKVKYEERKIKILNLLEKNREFYKISNREHEVEVFDELINNLKNEEFSIVLVYKTTAKNEHMRMMKDYLKKDIKSYLEDGDYNVKNILKQKMNSDMNLNKEKIREESKKNCIIYIEKEKQRLNDLMNESNETLNERYKKNEKHIENLVGIYKDLTGESQNESI